MPKSLLLIAIVYMGLVSAYIFAIPPGEAPDEPAHFLYIQYMVDTGTPPPALPAQRDSFWKNGFATSAYEWYQPPLYYWLGEPILSAARSLLSLPRYGPFPEINPEFPGQNRPLFVQTAFRFTEFHLLRFLSALLGLGTVIATFVLARRLLPTETWLPELAAGFVAFIPQFTFLHAYVTNDSLAILGSNLGLAALVHVAVTKPAHQRRAWLLAGCTLSIALAAKMTTWYLLPLGLLLALPYLLNGQRSATETAKDMLIFTGIASIVPLLSWLLWPDLLHRLLGSPQSQGINPNHLSLEHIRTILPMIHTSFWGMLGWVNMPIHSFSILVLDIIGILGLASATILLSGRWSLLTVGQRLGVMLLFAGLVTVTLLFVAFNLVTVQPQGRYFYPAISAIGFFVAYGWIRLAGPQRKIATFLILGLMFSINVLSLTTVILPAYGFFAG